MYYEGNLIHVLLRKSDPCTIKASATKGLSVDISNRKTILRQYIYLSLYWFHRLYVEILALTLRLKLSPMDTSDLVRLASPSGWTTSSVLGQSTTSPPVSPLALQIPVTAPTMTTLEYDVTVSCRFEQSKAVSTHLSLYCADT